MPTGGIWVTGDKSSVAAGAADGERGVLDSLVDDKTIAGARREGMLVAVQVAGKVQRRAPGLLDMAGTRLSPRRGGAQEMPELRWSGDGGEAGVAEEKPELLRSSDVVRWALSWRAWRTSRVKETRLTWGLGEMRRTS
jgi:hypothetical protein